MATLQELIEQKAVIDRAITAAQRQNREGAIAAIRALMTENGLTAADLVSTFKVGKKATSTKNQVAAKYRDADGNQWTGRGLKPKWLTAALSQGKALSDFTI